MNSPSEQPTPRTDNHPLRQIRAFDHQMEDIIPTEVARDLERELSRLRAIFPKILEAIGNGSACTSDASIEFMESIPGEVRSCVSRLRAELALRDAREEELRKEIASLKEELETEPISALDVLIQLRKQERCRVLLNVPDDEVLYSAIEDLLAERDALKDERDDLKQSLQVLTNSEQMWMEQCSDAQARLVSMKERLKSIRSIIEQPTEVPQLSLYEIDQIAESALQAIRSTKE